MDGIRYGSHVKLKPSKGFKATYRCELTSSWGLGITTLRLVREGAGDECFGGICPGGLCSWCVGGPGEGEPPKPGDADGGYPLLISSMFPGG